MKSVDHVDKNDPAAPSTSTVQSSSSLVDPKTSLRLENIVQKMEMIEGQRSVMCDNDSYLFCPSQIEDIDGVDDGDLYPTGDTGTDGRILESIAFLDEQKRYHEEKGTKEEQKRIDSGVKEDTINEFNCGKTISPSHSSSSAGAVRTLLKERGLRSTVANRTPQDFFFLRIIGEGAFSMVYFATEVNTGDEYAIKVLSKRDIQREKKVRYVLREKDIMASLTYIHGGHPFIVRLYCTFQDVNRLYFAITYAKHGELLGWLRRLGSFDDAVSLFYAAEILSALEYIHSCNIVHRDLKPENILIGADWHILLSDFGTAKVLGEHPDVTSSPIKLPTMTSESQSGGRSSFVGTAQYVSPEVLKSESVGPECDYWALGAIIFQMISGQPPFRAVNEYQIMRKILNLQYTFPDGFSPSARNLVERLLVHKCDRIGAKNNGGIDALKRHPYFESIDWNNLAKRTPPELKPYLPASSGEPAYYSDFQLPENLEPGLNDAAITRLMGLNNLFREIATIDSTAPGAPTVAAAQPVLAVNLEEERQRREAKIRAELLEDQRKNHNYHRFVEDNIIIKWGPIDKKKGLFARRRIFLLTEGPRLFYVDPTNMELKGEVPLSAEVRTEALNFRTFFVHTPKRTYYLFDPCRSAEDWCAKIDEVTKRYFSNQNEQQRPGTSGSTGS